jgi:hypothetical protein
LKLRKVLGIAARKEARRDPRLTALYASAKVEGLDSTLRMKKTVITFSARPFTGGLHEIYDWATLDEHSARELAEALAWSVRETLRRSGRKP